MNTVKCYHFCSNEFLEQLLKNSIIQANGNIPKTFEIKDEDGNVVREEVEAAYYAKDYAFKVKKINKGNGMFFAWSNPEYKGEIEYSETGKYSLLELNVPEDFVIKTVYENWCSFAMDVEEAEGSYEEADKHCKEDLGLEGGIEQSYNAIFDLRDKQMEVQILLPYINKSWIGCIKKCKNKHV